MSLAISHSKKVYVGKSAIHGYGILAKKDIKRGEIVFIIKGKPVHFIIRTKKDALVGPNWVGLAKNLWIDPSPPSLYLNHSCNPSAGIKGSVTVVALRDIKKGEEVVIDYSITEESTDWELDCECGARNCRKKIRSIQFLPAHIYDEYLPYIPRYFQKVYMRYHAHKDLRAVLPHAIPSERFENPVFSNLFPQRIRRPHFAAHHRVLIGNKNDR